MKTITVWTRQQECVLHQLQKTGRYTAQQSKVLQNEDALLMKTGYDWLAASLPQIQRPIDADYPIWLSLEANTAMLPMAGYKILELEIPADLITKINIAKWGAINNFSYLPANSSDLRQHRQKLSALGINDTKACMSRFYPELKAEIISSWQRLFDDSVNLGNDLSYGVVWELRLEWLQNDF